MRRPFDVVFPRLRDQKKGLRRVLAECIRFALLSELYLTIAFNGFLPLFRFNLFISHVGVCVFWCVGKVKCVVCVCYTNMQLVCVFGVVVVVVVVVGRSSGGLHQRRGCHTICRVLWIIKLVWA